MPVPAARLGRFNRETAHMAVASEPYRQMLFRWLPFAGSWTEARDFPAPQGQTFQSLWAKQERGHPQ